MTLTKSTGGIQMPLDGICLEGIATNEGSDHVGRALHLSGTLNQPSDSRKACQSPRYITFSLNQHLESLAHSLRID